MITRLLENNYGNVVITLRGAHVYKAISIIHCDMQLPTNPLIVYMLDVVNMESHGMTNNDCVNGNERNMILCLARFSDWLLSD